MQLASHGTAAISSTAARNFSLASAFSAMTSPPRSPRSAPGSVIAVNTAWLESSTRSTDALPVTQTAPANSSIMDGRDHSPSFVAGHDHSVNSLARALEGLSTDDPVRSPAALSLPAPTSPAPPSPSGPSSMAPVPSPSRRRARKFYSVTIGKRCGVFQQWCVYWSIMTGYFFPLTWRFRSYVKTLVDGVSGATFTGFRIYDDAVEDYFEAKAAGLVRVVRNPGDELVYGPLSMAVM